MLCISIKLMKIRSLVKDLRHNFLTLFDNPSIYTRVAEGRCVMIKEQDLLLHVEIKLKIKCYKIQR